MRKMYQLVLGVSALALCMSASVGAQEALAQPRDREAAVVRDGDDGPDLPESAITIMDKDIPVQDRSMWEGELERELEQREEDRGELTAIQELERERLGLTEGIDEGFRRQVAALERRT